MSEDLKIEYQCTRCGEKDFDKYSPVPPRVLNCWNCRAGLGMDISEMFRTLTGMFPVQQIVN